MENWADGREAHLGTLDLWNTGSMEGKLRKAYLGTLGLGREA